MTVTLEGDALIEKIDEKAAGVNLATKALQRPFSVRSGPTRTGKVDSKEDVYPVIYIFMEPSTAIPVPQSLSEPPI